MQRHAKDHITINLYLPADEVDAVRNIARDLGTSLSAIVSKLLTRYVETRETAGE